MPGMRFGLALHIGDVLYGNIGSGNRLDFTCIGPAVNFAARIEKLTGRLGRAIVASEEFARHCPGQLRVGAVTGLDRDDMTANAMTDEREIANDIEDFVPNEFIRETKRLFA